MKRRFRADSERSSLRSFLNEVVARASDVEPATKTVWGHTIRNLCEFFGDDRPLPCVTEGDAEDFLRYFSGDQELAVSTSGKRLQFAKSFFEQARKFKLIDTNPFANVKGPTAHDASREVYVSRKTMERLFEVCDTT